MDKVLAQAAIDVIEFCLALLDGQVPQDVAADAAYIVECLREYADGEE